MRLIGGSGGEAGSRGVVYIYIYKLGSTGELEMLTTLPSACLSVCHLPVKEIALTRYILYERCSSCSLIKVVSANADADSKETKALHTISAVLLNDAPLPPSR